MKVALVHDWLTGMRGGEKVLECLGELFPEADIFTLVLNRPNVSAALLQHRIQTSFIQHLPFAQTKYQHYLPLFPMAIEQFDLRAYDLVISTSHCVAKGVITRPETLHLCYCFTPMRYAWDQTFEYFPKEKSSFFKYQLLSYFLSYLRTWDAASSARVNYFSAISKHVATRIDKYYNQKAEVIYPPADVEFFKNEKSRGEDFYLIVSALVPYKRIDLAIKVFNTLGWPLVIIGEGVERKRLEKTAGSTVRFLGWRSNEELRDYYSKCKALVFPGEEDFGIVPVEAQAMGKPVVAYAKGGCLETVIPGESGLFFNELSETSLVEALKTLASIKFDPEKIRRNAQRFNRENFKHNFLEFINTKYKAFREGRIHNA